MAIKTKFLIISDTHAQDFQVPDIAVDVAIHCGDLTEESKLDEFRKSIDQLERIRAPLKLVIAGNHDLALDTQCYRKKIAEATRVYPDDSALRERIEETYGHVGAARQLFEHTEDITFLDEGQHTFILQNGARLNVYASPFTPSLGDWALQFKPGDGHDFALNGAHVVITHGPPRGVLDLTASRQRAGSKDLFAAVAKARPRLHCFGHIHEAWGAKLVAWRGEQATHDPTHFSDIDNDATILIASLATVKPQPVRDTTDKDQAEETEIDEQLQQEYRKTSHCSDDDNPIVAGRRTLFVNAAIESLERGKVQLPWVVDIELPKAE